MTKMKIQKILIMVLLFSSMVNADCGVLDGNCSIGTTTYGDQLYQGTTYYSTNLNVTISGDTSGDTMLCNISCITNKSHGYIINKTNGATINMSWCSLGASIISGSVREVYARNISTFVLADGQCNSSFAIWLNGTQNIVVEIKSTEARSSGSQDFPLVPVGIASSLLIAAIIIRRWWKMRRR